MMKILKLLALALSVAALTTACGDDNDEPVDAPAAAEVSLPTFPAGHKAISHMEKTFKNGLVAKVDATYDSGDHLVSVNMELPYKGGTTTESVKFDYTTATITHTLGWQTHTYSFTTNSKGFITLITNSRGLEVCRPIYDGDQLQSLSSSSGSANSYKTAFYWRGSQNLQSITTRNVNVADTTAIYYSKSYPNSAHIDVLGLGQSPFGNLIELVLRSARLFGDVNAELPGTMNCGNNSYLDDSGHIAMLRCTLDYEFNADGSVSDMTFGVKRSADDEQLGNIEPYTLSITYK